MSEHATILACKSSARQTAEELTGDAAGVRVLHVIDWISMGGTPNLLIRSLRELERRGVTSHLCVLASAETTDESYRDLVQPTYLNFPGDYRNPLSVRRCVGQLQALIDDWQPDILHSYLWVADYVSAQASVSRKTGHISHIVDRREWQASRKLVHRIRRTLTQRALNRAGTTFLAVSQAAKDFACQHMGYSPNNVAVAANGIDWREYSYVPAHTRRRETLVLGTAGRVEYEKGHSFLLEAVARLVEHGHLVELRITGEGPLKQELQSFVDQRELNGHVKFLGWVPSVREFYRELDLFVVPSVSAEGLPTTILEAMASGCVVVASDVGGTGEAIRHGVDGCLVPPRDADALVQEIVRLVDNPDSLTRMADSARQRVGEQFTTEKMVDVICRTYAATRKAGHSQ